MSDTIEHMKTSRGFTLAEIVTVVAIVSLLTVVIVASTSSTRQKPRDTQRYNDLLQMKVALSMYVEDYGHYPYSCNTSLSLYGIASFDSPTYASNEICSVINSSNAADKIGTLTTVLAPYISKLKDPKNLGSDSGYLYQNPWGATSYCFHMYRTPENLKNFPSTVINPVRCGGFDSSGKCNVNGSNGFQQNDVYIGAGSGANGC